MCICCISFNKNDHCVAVGSQFLQNNSNYGTFREGHFAVKHELWLITTYCSVPKKGVKPFWNIQHTKIFKVQLQAYVKHIDKFMGIFNMEFNFLNKFAIATECVIDL